MVPSPVLVYSDVALSEYHLVVRVEPALKELIRKVAEARGEQVSNFVRRAVKTELAKLSFFDEETKKALGVRPENSGKKSCRAWRGEPGAAGFGVRDALGGTTNPT
jgi:hypothetical protein